MRCGSQSNGNAIGRITIDGVITECPIGLKDNGTTAMPMSITAGPDGALWFTKNNPDIPTQIGRITTDCVKITEYRISTILRKGFPFAITTGSDGALWFTEGNNTKIGRITTDGVITDTSIPTSNSALFGITMGPDGLWFTEYQGSEIGRLYNKRSKI